MAMTRGKLWPSPAQPTAAGPAHQHHTKPRSATRAGKLVLQTAFGGCPMRQGAGLSPCQARIASLEVAPPRIEAVGWPGSGGEAPGSSVPAGTVAVLTLAPCSHGCPGPGAPVPSQAASLVLRCQCLRQLCPGPAGSQCHPALQIPQSRGRECKYLHPMG